MRDSPHGAINCPTMSTPPITRSIAAIETLLAIYNRYQPIALDFDPKHRHSGEGKERKYPQAVAAAQVVTAAVAGLKELGAIGERNVPR